jgi:hypothetical protein
MTFKVPAIFQGLLTCCSVLAWSLIGTGWVGAQDLIATSSVLKRTLQRFEVNPKTLDRFPLPFSETPSPVRFPSAFFGNPISEVTALERWESTLQAMPASPSSSLNHTLTMAYGDPAWQTELQTETQQRLGKRGLAPVTLAIDWPTDLPADIRQSTEAMLQAIARAQVWRQIALSHWPIDVSASQLWQQFTPRSSGHDSTNESVQSVQTLLNAINHRAMAQGLWELTRAVEKLQQKLKTSTSPGGTWQFGSPWGPVRIDTTTHRNLYRGEQPVLLIDSGGNDTYSFDKDRTSGVTVLLDLTGDDRYTASGQGHDPSSATLGYAVLWDASGNDRYQGQWLTQGAALFGGALLVDRSGHDHYEAQGLAQGYALGGVAVLIDNVGNDHYTALTQAQAAAGPGAVAMLMDSAGNDQYVLGNTPLVLPSAQLKDRNASLGQGCAYGLRPIAGQDGATVPGGLALLMDGQGNDHYTAQVFAQGAGYEGGLGILIDGGGSDHMTAAWYAMGAAAHQASGVFIARGDGKDRYSASHATAIGAAHDDSLAVFLGSTGNDHYSVANLGLGAANDGSRAIFIDRGGSDQYEHESRLCMAFGASVLSTGRPDASGDVNLAPVNTALFIDLGGDDQFPATCTQAINNSHWTSATSVRGLGTGFDVAAGRHYRPTLARPASTQSKQPR